MDEIANDTYLIVFDDTEVPPEVVVGEDLAYKLFEHRQDNWNCHLFKIEMSNEKWKKKRMKDRSK